MDNLPPMPENKKLLIEAYLKQKEAVYSMIKQKSGDLFIFNKYVLGVEKGKKELGTFHRELCTFVTDDIHKKKLILMPRGHLKSTLVTIGYSTQRIVQNPNVRILLLSATWQMAVDFLTEIKSHLRGNELLGELFPEIPEAAKDPAPEWAQDRITLRRTDTNIKGPTVWAAGVESNLVGSHPDVIILDDVVSRDNVATPEQIDKVKLRYRDCLDLLEPGGQLIVIGTRWSEGDLYSWLMDKDQGILSSYDVLIKRAYEGDLEGEDFTALWPEKFDQKELLTRQREKGWYEFSAQYLNDPIPDKDATFQKEWIQRFDIEDVRGKELVKVLTIDPAISLEKQADYTAMVVSGIDTFGNIFILDMVRDKLTPSQLIDKIFYLYEMWHPTQIGVETVSYQKAIAYSLKDEMQKRRRYLPIVELKPNERTKDLRIRGLQPQYQGLKVFHRNGHAMTPYLENELKAFPRGIHDDLVDAFSYSLDLLYPPKMKSTRFQKQYLY